MAHLAHRDVYAMNRIEARLRLVTTYEETATISETARHWPTAAAKSRNPQGKRTHVDVVSALGYTASKSDWSARCQFTRLYYVGRRLACLT